jgi:hypothetical protein
MRISDWSSDVCSPILCKLPIIADAALITAFTAACRAALDQIG